MQLLEFRRYVIIDGQMRVLTKEFFRTNVYRLDGSFCQKCIKGPLGRFDRVDCEFWPGENSIESYCLECWARS